MKQLIVNMLLAGMILLACCDDSETLYPSDIAEYEIVIPQGDHDYDDRIVEWFERTGVYILYQFDSVDVYYHPTSGWGNFSVKEADEDYVGAQLDFVEKNFLNFYPDEVLRKCMPLKICLGKELIGALFPGNHYQSHFNNLIISHGDATLTALTAEERETFKSQINNFLLERIVNSLSLEAFYDVSDYSWTSSVEIPATSECYSLGFILQPNQFSGENYFDAIEFAKMIITNPYEKLTEEPESAAYNRTDFTGILHPKKDVNGLILEKYKLIVAAFAEWGIDLQKIGDTPATL